MVTADVLIFHRRLPEAETLARVVSRSLSVTAEALDQETAVEDALCECHPVLVIASAGRAEDYALLVRTWRIRPETPTVVISPTLRLDAHRFVGPMVLIPERAAPRSILSAVRRGLQALPWLDEGPAAPRGIPPVMPVDVGAVDVMHMLRQDPLTFNVWREAANPAFLPGVREAPQTSHTLSKAFLPRADLSRANLTRMDLPGACLREAYGAFTSFEDANLRGADLSGALFVGASFAGADLRGANLDGAELVACGLERADLEPGALASALIVDCDVDPELESPRPRSA